MNNLIKASEFEQLFVDDRAMIDLRAPVEFTKGAFPTSKNYPLLNDPERQKIGRCYKQQGQEAAIALGHQLVTGDTKDQRMQAWKQFIKSNPDGCLYCFRGGLRSKTVQQWLLTEELDYPLVEGGYKALRQFLIQQMESLVEQKEFIIIGGKTGSRKTDLIVSLPNALDLEGRANHRGSSFGRRVGGQPTVISYENQLSVDALKIRDRFDTIVLEDEGVTVGRCSVPAPLRKQITNSPIALIEASLDERVENILNDYVLTLSDEYLLADPVEGYKTYKNEMFASLFRIKKRLGGERYSRLFKLMDNAFDELDHQHRNTNHRAWIRVLIEEYYDPMYEYQIQKKNNRVIVKGNWESISAYFK